MRRRRGEVAAVAAAHRRDRIRRADQRRQRDVGGMRIADRVVLDRAQAEPLRGVVGRLLQPAIVEPQRFGLAIFQKQLAVVGAREPPRDLAADGIAVEIGAVEEGGCGGIGHQISPLSEGRIQDSCFPAIPRGAGSTRCRDDGFSRNCSDNARPYRKLSSSPRFRRAGAALSLVSGSPAARVDAGLRSRQYQAGLSATGRGVGRAGRRLVRCRAQAKADLCPCRRSRHGPVAGIPAAGAGRALDPADARRGAGLRAAVGSS